MLSSSMTRLIAPRELLDMCSNTCAYLGRFRLDNLDTYSNILYVKEQKMQLSFIAHSALRNEKYRPETCCIIGNYYSLKSQVPSPAYSSKELTFDMYIKQVHMSCSVHQICGTHALWSNFVRVTANSVRVCMHHILRTRENSEMPSQTCAASML